MTTKLQRRFGALILAFACVLVAVGGPTSAGAQDPAKPAPCKDVLITDAPGDQLLFPTVVGGLTATASKGPDNTDIRRVFFNLKDGVLTANMEVTNLTKAYPPQAAPNNGVQWAIWFDLGDITHYVKAVSDGSAITYKHGGYTIQDTAVLGELGDTTGTFTEGANGVVSVVVPAAFGIKEGTALTAVSGRVAFKKKDADNSYSADRAPDASADDKSYTATACPAEAAPSPEPTAQPTAEPTPAPSGGTPPPSGGTNPSPSGGTQPGQTQSTPAKKKARKKSCTAKAKKIKNAKKRKAALKKCKKAKKKKR